MNSPAQGKPAASSKYDPISYTAKKILQKRACHTTIPFAREIAEAAGITWRISRARAWAQLLVWGRVRSGLYLQFRHDAISGALSAYPGSPILEIGAGFGTRGISEAFEREAYIESDLPNLIEQKKRLVETVLLETSRPNHHFIAVNACSADDMEEAAKFILTLRLRAPLVIVNEGILMYLTDDEQRSFRDNVRAFLERCSPCGAWISPDFSERDYEESFMQKWMTRALTQRVGRRFNRFQSDEAASEFLAQGGFRGAKLPNLMRDHPDAEVRQVGDSFRVWSITLQSSATT
jgi:O-methyltransferase involved in polyketide biosynthesis